ncbi:MAG: ERF family protein [Eubacterium sp.]|nr:ERF family protein [Eubacterium sp.]
MITEILQNIQTNLKAPKSQYNNFGKYKYRSCEDILEAVKPLLLPHKAALTLDDEIVMVGERYYIKATATLQAGDEAVSTTAYAREDASKKGMDGAQLTGATSSYARKYALSGLLALDDTKDADDPATQGNSNTIPKSKAGSAGVQALRQADRRIHRQER